ncbi:MAG: maltotransferase domain-containing protein [Elusimicrobiota bacterium]|jgi:starch synthase (maltosyl-transferring)
MTLPSELPDRVIIEQVTPEIDGGRFPIKRCTGDEVVVQAVIHTYSTDPISAVLRYRFSKDGSWTEIPLKSLNAGLDLWEGRFVVDRPGSYEYTLAAWVDPGQSTTYRCLPLVVEPERARFGAWYELFPRSAGPDPSRSATFREAEARLPEISRMGFDVLYLPPVHPIGTSFRKGPNNSPVARPEDPGCPWAIGSGAGGHRAIEPGLGTLEDFGHFVNAAQAAGLEIALDLAFQCSPDHPYVREHPEWFKRRPDGSIRCAENPPNKFEDIYPLNFECADWLSLWQELLEVTLFWIQRGVHLFRVDNPHTKTFHFWEWFIREVHERHPDVIFLAEAFTRPRVMHYLSKCGFSQSYTYFIWRTTKYELTHYFQELTQSDVKEYLRPNLFVNTPDVLHTFLQTGGRPAFQIRLILAATLAASYGIYGPPFELGEWRTFPWTEDYADSEKYQIRSWEWDRHGNIKDLIALVNRIRRENPALHFNANLSFHPVKNESLLVYGKITPDRSNRLLIVVNLDPHRMQSGVVTVPVQEWGLPEHYEVHDLLSDRRFLWHGAYNFVQLDPQLMPAHIFRIR